MLPSITPDIDGGKKTLVQTKPQTHVNGFGQNCFSSSADQTFISTAQHPF